MIVADVVPVPSVVAVGVDLDAVVDVDLFRAHPRRVDEFLLFGFAVAQRSGAFERVEVVLVEGFFGDGRARHPGGPVYNLHLHNPPVAHARLNFIHVPGHELDARVLEGLAGLVVHGDPAHDVDQVALLGCDNVVVGLPAHAAGDVGKLGGKFPGFVGGQHPLQARLQDGVIGETGEDRRAGKAEAQLAVDLDDGRLGGTSHLGLIVLLTVPVNGEIVVWRVSAADYFAFDDLRSLRCPNLEIDRLTFVEGEQQRLGYGVGAIVLLQHLYRVLAGEIAQNDGVGLQVHGDVIQVDLVFAGLQVQRDFLAHDGEILVIDGEGGLRRLREETSQESDNAKQNADEASDHQAEPPGNC